MSLCRVKCVGGVCANRQVSEGDKRVFRTLEDGDQKAGGRRGNRRARAGGMKQAWDGQEVNTPYPVSAPFDEKRQMAQVTSKVMTDS